MLRKPYAFAGLLALASLAGSTTSHAQIASATPYEPSVRVARAETPASVDPRAASLRLRALTLDAQGDEREAQRAVDGMIRIQPRYAAQPGDTPAFNGMVASAQARYSSGDLTRRRKGVPQFVYTGLVVGMSALTVGLGVSAAQAQ